MTLRARPLRAAAVWLALGGLACARPLPPAPGPLEPEPDALAYGLPTASPAFYILADTAMFTVDSGAMGRMSVSAAYRGTVEVDIGAGRDALEARVRFHRLDGMFEAQAQRPQRVDEADVDGEFLLTVDAQGRTETVAEPRLSQRLLDVTSADAMVRPLFVRLPGRPATPGETWVDTIVSLEHRSDGRSQVRTVMTTTLIGDTIVDGRALILLRTRADNQLEVEGRSGGVLVRQLLTGTTDGTVLWDPHFRMIVQRSEDGSLTGSLEMPGAGAVAVPLTARVRRHVRLEGVGTPENEEREQDG